MHSIITRNLLAVTLLGIAVAPTGAQQTVYAIGAGGSTLVSFPSNNPGAATVVGTFGGADAFLDAIDFRPATGQLYGYRDATHTLYTVNLNTAALTTAVVGNVNTNTFELGMDFNPSIDRLRVVTDSGQNLVYNPNGGSVTNATALSYAPGDINAGKVPVIIDNAYAGNVANSGFAATQYAIDIDANTLVTLANNTGVLTTVGSLGVAANTYTGFDIFTAPDGTNTAYALFNGDTNPGLYSINLATGAATFRGGVGGTASSLGLLYSLAVTPSPAAVPEPGALALFAGVMSGGLLLRRRK